MNKKLMILSFSLIITLAGFYSIILLNPIENEPDPLENEVEHNLRSSNGLPVVVVYVNSTIYSSIQTEVLRYVQDITAQGYNVTLLNWSVTLVDILKANITAFYQYGLEGVILIGELPYAIARYKDNAWVVYREFPTDLFLMDLDGLWQDVVIPNGRYDIDHTNGFIEHTNGTGDWEPEIWLGRISPYSMGMPGINYTQELIDYFDRNHDYRLGVISRPHNATLYIDDDWSGVKDEWISNFTAYTGSSVDVYATDALTTAANYIQQLNKTDYEFVHLLVHSWQTNHTFGPVSNLGSEGVLTYDHIYGNDTRPFFYNLYACFSCDYTVTNNTGTYYLFSNDTLVVIGSARSGGMDLYQPFYDNLSQNATIGKAFHTWFYNPEIEIWAKTELYYGMTIFGDPLLTILMNDPPLESITITNPDATKTWYNSTQYYINWTSTGSIAYINISLYNSSGWVQNIALNVTNNGSYSWTVPNSLYSGNYYINVSDASDNNTNDISDTFSIQVVGDSITLTNPVSTSTWYKTQQYEIKWTWTGGFTTVQISLQNASGLVLLLTSAGGTPNDGSFLWTVPDNLADGSEYFFKIDDMDGIPSDESDNFTIALKPADPTNGGTPPPSASIPGIDLFLLGIISSMISVTAIKKRRKRILK